MCVRVRVRADLQVRKRGAIALTLALACLARSIAVWVCAEGMGQARLIKFNEMALLSAMVRLSFFAFR